MEFPIIPQFITSIKFLISYSLSYAYLLSFDLINGGIPLALCVFFVFGRYGARAQKSRDTNDRSGGSHVLVTGVVLISIVGVEIVLEWIAAMHADGIDVGMSAIS